LDHICCNVAAVVAIRIMSAQIAEDASRDTGLSPLAEAALSLAAGQLAAALIDELKLNLLPTTFSGNTSAPVTARG
jgi:hypothetical protein